LFLRRWRDVMRYFLVWVKTTPGKLLIAAGVAYALSWPFDHAVIPLPRDQLYFGEELADSLATTLMLLTAILVFRDLRRSRRAAPVPVPAPAERHG